MVKQLWSICVNIRDGFILEKQILPMNKYYNYIFILGTLLPQEHIYYMKKIWPLQTKFSSIIGTNISKNCGYHKVIYNYGILIWLGYTYHGAYISYGKI